MKKTFANIKNICEMLEWNIEEEDTNCYDLSYSSPAGQDFHIQVTGVTIEEFINNLYEVYNDFDCSYEAFLWIGEDGHGINGAPNDMKDVYEDMEACCEAINNLYTALITTD